VVDDGEPFAEKMERLVQQLDEQLAESARLVAAIRFNFRSLGFNRSEAREL
jgi:type I restriction enzyme M protein